MASNDRIVLSCPSCSRQTTEQLSHWLRAVGMLRRAGDTDIELLWQLLPSAAAKADCDFCGHTGLVARAHDDSELDDSDVQWPEAAACKACGALIPAERLEVFPGAKYCARCQQGRENPAPAEREFCPRCGSVLSVRSNSRGGITRYEQTCSACGYRG